MSTHPEAEKTVSRILTESILTVEQARNEIFSITGQRPDKATIHRWIHRGVGGVKLEAVRFGGRGVFTSTEAINRFVVARTSTLQ